jgi:hypothetical protein
MVIIGIDDRCPALEIGEDRDRIRGGLKLPRLGVVAIRGERRIPDQVRHARIGRKRRAQAGHGLGIIVQAGPCAIAECANCSHGCACDQDLSSRWHRLPPALTESRSA